MNRPHCTSNSTTDRIARYAMAAGLRPYSRLDRVYHGARTIILDGEGVDAAFGAVIVGARSGKVLRATITYGNEGPTRRFAGALAVQRALKELDRGGHHGR